jgi:hypothetical protein
MKKRDGKTENFMNADETQPLHWFNTAFIVVVVVREHLFRWSLRAINLARPPFTMKEARCEEFRGMDPWLRVNVIGARILVFIVVGKAVVGLTEWAWPAFGFWVRATLSFASRCLRGRLFSLWSLPLTQRGARASQYALAGNGVA